MTISSTAPRPLLTLRPYQREAIHRINQAFSAKKGFVLVQAATGAGKTIIFCTLIKELLENTPWLRIAVLAHRRELASQARDKLLSIWPEAPIGLACSSLEKKANTSNKVTIGTIQTLARQSKFTPFHVIIIDEVHRLPTKETNSQFGTFLKEMLELNHGVQVLGVTATPYRLGHGYIFGQHCKTPWANWFEKLSYAIGIPQLQAEGFLCSYHYMISDSGIQDELRQVESNDFGDYRIDQLEKVVIRQQHLLSAVKTLQTHAKKRQGIIVFCVSIGHAELLRDELNKVGIESAAVHSEMPNSERDHVLKSFDLGELRVLTNVNVLTEGWDSPRADCVMLCRPTLSTALYVQMVGRGLRTHPQKKDCLVLDLSGCFQKHGSIKCPIVRIDNEKMEDSGAKERERHCPECSEVIPLSTVQCPYCDRDLKPCVVFLDNEQNMVRIEDHPDNVVLCEECCRPFPWNECKIEWMSEEFDASTPGVLYCPQDHLIKALDPPYLASETGHYDVIRLRSKLHLDKEELGLSIGLLLTDNHLNPCFIEFTFAGEADLQKLQAFTKVFSTSPHSDLSELEPFGLPAHINRRSWDFSKGIELTKSSNGLTMPLFTSDNVDPE